MTTENQELIKHVERHNEIEQLTLAKKKHE